MLNKYEKNRIISRKSPISSYLGKKSILVLGSRGSGKSFYLNQLLEGNSAILKVNLLEIETYQKYLKSPSILRKEIKFRLQNAESLIVFIDEIQKIPDLLNEVHDLIEMYKPRCSFILTGSSARKLKRNNANLLAGRALYFPFFNFSFEEVDFDLNLEKVLQFGSLPEAFLENDLDLVINYLKTYTHTYLKEEILQEALTRNVEGFNHFLELASFMNGSTVNYQKIARQIGVANQTVKEYFQILEDTLIAYRIPAFTYSTKKQLQTSPKYYFFDNGILNTLRGEIKTELLESSFRYGQLFENMVMNEIIKFKSNHQIDVNLYHYRTNHGVEIDCILQKNITTIPIAVEVKSSKEPTAKDVKNLNSLLQDHPHMKRIVICRCENPYEDDGIEFLPYLDGIKTLFNFVI